jgi:hypothetical protein
MGRLEVSAPVDFGSGNVGPTMDPVFVLCMGRSGSTLLRLVLDTHPELACPPETNIPALCSQLAVVWSLIEGAPLSLQRGDAPPAIPDAAIAGIRQTMDAMTAPYLRRRGKRYIADSPGNSVMALARYWLDGASAIASVLEQHPDNCHRVRYEDLVSDPERVAGAIFDFLGVDQVPGIADALFAGEHERFGPADHKIWYTSEISQASIGRSDSLPVGLIPPPIQESINRLLDQLGYVQVDESWGTADMPASLLVSDDDGKEREQQQVAQLPEAEILSDRLAAGLARHGASLPTRWKAQAGETFTVVIREPHSAPWVRTVDLGAGVIVSGNRAAAAPDVPNPDVPNPDVPDMDADGGEDGPDEDWSIVGTAQAWARLLDGDLNMSTALRRNEVRYCDYGENDYFVTEARITLLAALLRIPALTEGAAGDRQSVPALADQR